MHAYTTRIPALVRPVLIGLCAWTLCAPRTAAAVEAPEAASAAPLAERLQVLVEALNEHGVAFDGDAAYETVVASLIKVADPAGGPQTAAAEEALTRRRAGTIYDAGLRLHITNESVRITHIREDTPARETDLEKDSTLLNIDQTDVSGLGLHRIIRLLRSDANEPVTLTVQTVDGFTLTQRVDRVETTLPDIESRETLPFQLAYLHVNRLHEGTGASIAETISGWAAEKRYGVLLDLRGADGTDLDSVIAVGELLAEPGGLLFAYRDKDDQDIHVAHAGDVEPLTLPVMVLVDSETGGAAEVLAAVLSDSVRGVMVFGQPTRGDMLVRDAVDLSDGSRLYLATRRLVTADGTVYTGMDGVRPDVISARIDEDASAYKPVRSSRTEVLDEEIEQEKLYNRVRGDATLRRAVDVLLGLKALDIRPRASNPHHSR